MIKGGKGGTNTTCGLRFEEKTDFLISISQKRGYSVTENKVIKNGKVVATSHPKHKFYKFLLDNGVDFREYISCKLLPDEAIYIPKLKTFFIIEKKFQHVGGSTDEKLQTAPYKIGQFKKLLDPLEIRVNYIYILNDWFINGIKYRDVLEYIDGTSNCEYFIDELPLDIMGL